MEYKEKYESCGRLLSIDKSNKKVKLWRFSRFLRREKIVQTVPFINRFFPAWLAGAEIEIQRKTHDNRFLFTLWWLILFVLL